MKFKNSILIVLLIFALGFGLALTNQSLAQTNSNDSASVEALQNVVLKLMEQLKELQVRVAALKSTTAAVSSKVEIVKSSPEKAGFIVLEELPGNPRVSCVLPELMPAKKHNSVYLLQMVLNKAGFYPEGFITGYYGKLTTAAVERLQKANGLTVSGQVDEATARVINLLI